MVSLRASLVLGLTMFFVHGALAQTAAQLAESKGCMACHDVSQTKVGPSFSDIAAQFKGQADAPAKLVDQLKNGSDGHPKIDASDAELQQLVAYVLGTT